MRDVRIWSEGGHGVRAARRAHAGIMPGVGIRQGLIPTPSAIIPTSGALYHRLPPPLTGGARAGQMAWRRWSGIEGPHVQPPPHYPAYPMAACQVSYARPSLCLAPLLDLKNKTQLKRKAQFAKQRAKEREAANAASCLLYTSPSPRDATLSRMPSSA